MRSPTRAAATRQYPASLARVHRRIVACDACPRLRDYCRRVASEKKAAYRQEAYWGKPVPGFGDPHARLLVLGLAPAAHGANRTGRVFTGDGSGDFLMRAMHAHGFASLPTARRADDGLVLTDAYITATVRCAPPANKPVPAEIAECRRHLEAEFQQLRRVCAIVALGRIAFDAVWRLLDSQCDVVLKPRPGFVHGLVVRPAGGPVVIASYHPSRQNTNTGRLTPAMLSRVFVHAKALLR